MLRRAVVGSWILGACAPAGPPDTPAAREAVAVCGADAPPAVIAKNVPHWRFRAAFEAAEKLAVSPDMKELARRYGQLDLAEHAGRLQATVAAVGVGECRLADEMLKVARAEPSAGDCDALVDVLEASQAVSPEHLDAIMAAGCAEIAGCARECVPGLSRMGEVPPEQAEQALALGCTPFRYELPVEPSGIRKFVRARLAGFADACAPQFGAQAGRAAELRRSLGL